MLCEGSGDPQRPHPQGGCREVVAIEKILAYDGLDAFQALAFGDSQNDLEMLQVVGTGVAMGNATAQLKAIAEDVCAPVAEDGIYYDCASHGLI